MREHYPVIGQWFSRSGGMQFEVVATDEDARTIEIQQFDGTIDELDLEAWAEILPVEISPPEDWSGSVDMDPEDYLGKKRSDIPAGYHNPLAFLDKHRE